MNKNNELNNLNNKFGIDIKESSEKKAVVERTTRESKIKVCVEFTPIRNFKINTSLEFLNHMIETIAWRMCANIDVSVDTKNFKLTHVITEDTGLVLGKALEELFKQRLEKGVNGFGFSKGIIDEASTTVSVSIEGRPEFYLRGNAPGIKVERVEDMLSNDLDDFLKGLALGMNSTIQVDVEYGDDPHHTWESVFRALGEALRVAFEKNEWRRGTTVGVKGTLE